MVLECDNGCVDTNSMSFIQNKAKYMQWLYSLDKTPERVDVVRLNGIVRILYRFVKVQDFYVFESFYQCRKKIKSVKSYPIVERVFDFRIPADIEFIELIESGIVEVPEDVVQELGSDKIVYVPDFINKFL